MPRPQTNPIPLALPPSLDPDQLPRHITAQQAAQIHHRYYGPLSPRTLRETWPLAWRLVAGRAVTETTPFLAEAKCRFESAPMVIGSRFPGALASTITGRK